jgi:ligand-binding sensor domain-containing protein
MTFFLYWRNNRILAGLFMGFTMFIGVYGQLPNNSWRDHLSYSRSHHIAITPEKVFCAMESGGMASVDKRSGELEKYSKVTGLSDVNINSIAYSETTNTLVIGYRNGNIDLLTSAGLTNMPDIKRKQITGVKTVYEIVAYEESAFLACGVGIIHLDLSRQEIKDSYFFGTGGSPLKVFDLTILGNYIYAATEFGVYKADLNAPNLVDFNYWQHLDDLPQSGGEYKEIESIGDELLAVYSDKGIDNIIRISTDDSWISWNPLSETKIHHVGYSNTTISIATNNNIYLYTNSFLLTDNIDIPAARYGLIDNDGTLYAASVSGGFKKYTSNGGLTSYYISGPWFNTTSYIDTKDDEVWVGSGSKDNAYVNGAAYNFSNERWSSILGSSQELGSVGNFYKFAYHSTNSKRVYASSYRYGLYLFENNKVVKQYTRDTEPLFQSAFSSTHGVRIMGLQMDNKGDLWTVSELTVQPVLVFRGESDWEQLELNSPLFRSATTRWRELVITENNQIWLLSERNGVVVLKDLGDGSFLEKHFPLMNQDGDILSAAYCMTEDKEGNIWIGTNRGPIIYNTSNQLFDEDNVTGTQIKIPRNDGTNLADFLLDYEIVRDIAVDGGNRKWMATATSGVFLVEEDGKETIHQFIEGNSPMISNNVLSVGIQEKTGEVFISTDKGLVGFMGQATEGGEDFSDVYVYPNPVRPGYEGDITITGLIKDASVKITDISGNLVYETTSLGGQAVWNGKNFDGNRVQTGVYLVFLTNSDGSKTHIAKLVFIH